MRFTVHRPGRHRPLPGRVDVSCSLSVRLFLGSYHCYPFRLCFRFLSVLFSPLFPLTFIYARGPFISNHINGGGASLLRGIVLLYRYSPPCIYASYGLPFPPTFSVGCIVRWYSKSRRDMRFFGWYLAGIILEVVRWWVVDGAARTTDYTWGGSWVGW